MNPTIIIGYRVFSEMRATRLVKDDIKRKGHKWSQYSAAEKKTMIQMYLELHPELAQAAKVDVDRLTLEGAFGKRAQRELRAKLRSDAQPTPPCSDKEISVQMSGAK